MTDERPPEQIATDIRDAVDALNRLVREAEGDGLAVELEVQRVNTMDAARQGVHVHLSGVYRRVEPTPRPATAPPPPRGRRGHD